MEQNRRDQRSYDKDNPENQSYNRESDYNQRDYSNYTNRDYDYNQRGYGGQGYNQLRNYENYGRGNEYNQGMGMSSDYGGNRDNVNEYGFGGYGNQGTRSYGRGYGNASGHGNYSGRWNDNDYGGHGSTYGNMGDYRSSYRSDWNRNRDWDRTRDWNRHREGNEQDRDWWDKTKDEVSSWFGDEDADRRRNWDRMRGHRGKGPKNYQRSEERIREDVCDHLSDDYIVDASDIDIKVSGSEVILAGIVNSREEKRRAEDIAESVSGVTNVQNQLRVGQYSSSQSRPTMGNTTGTTGTTNR
jgi:osmotically-inducible protein OsmY